MIGWVVWLAAQAAAATVGDTVWVGRSVAVPSGQILRPQSWDLGEVGQSLGAPEVLYRGDSATVRYPLVLWLPGRHRLTVPGPIVVSLAGRSDTLPNVDVVIDIASVLPADQPKASLAPRGAAPLLPQSSRSLWPVIVLVGGVGAIGGAVWALRQRRRRERAAVAPLPAAPEPAVGPLLAGWLAAGEVKTTLDGWAHLLERELTRTTDAQRRERGQELLGRMEIAGFRPDASGDDPAALIDRARAWVRETGSSLG
jgi:hypothetical protein